MPPLFPAAFEAHHRVASGLYAQLRYLLPDAQQGLSQADSMLLVGSLLALAASLAQFLTAVPVGRVADTYGRKPALLVVLLATLVAHLLPLLLPQSMAAYSLSRVLAGAARGVTQLAMTVSVDLSSRADTGPTATAASPPGKAAPSAGAAVLLRARALAFTGIAIALGFTVGPVLGVGLARAAGRGALAGASLRVLSTGLSTGLDLLAIMLTVLLFREPIRTKAPADGPTGVGPATPPGGAPFPVSYGWLCAAQLVFSCFLSAFEHSLTFILSALRGFSSADHGRLLALSGLVAILSQGGISRRLSSRAVASVSDKPNDVRRAVRTVSSAAQVGTLLLGMASCLVAVAAGPRILPGLLLDTGAWSSSRVGALVAVPFGVASGLVGPMFTALASLASGGETSNSAQRVAHFRSVGFIGRVLGPVCVTVLISLLSASWGVLRPVADALGVSGFVVGTGTGTGADVTTSFGPLAMLLLAVLIACLPTVLLSLSTAGGELPPAGALERRVDSAASGTSARVPVSGAAISRRATQSVAP
ncbi:hypothetical protein H696_01308 [Fonticula alba]|uniref:Major facilitator superfamily (MFS) profile domain-containing protein n=1 Tax=Fonticula alba TaxID=691883 RepID=A0A058ZBX5_FONAL|nr:hypothetical protein H696_01308 [Fonticula alba]KCV71899.1 hypothetical protein H696_01308 [Fonticula alba]|eukprot:XP_009493477.1 hypothetical protein H696_01308 [Fonticula alba]